MRFSPVFSTSTAPAPPRKALSASPSHPLRRRRPKTRDAARCRRYFLHLRGRHRLETVEECVVETQTGAQHRRPEQRIDEATLRADFRAVYVVSGTERAAALELRRNY